MNRLHLILGGLALTSCTTTQMDSKPPIATYNSARTRDAVTECLLNRLNTDNRIGKVVKGPAENVITFGGPLGAVLGFTVRDNGSGSYIEMRRLSSITPGKTNAESCF
jgi:hypothetical protein